MPPRRLLALASLLLAAACTGQPTAGDTTVVRHPRLVSTAPDVQGPAVRGTVRDTAGRPVAGATVHVTVQLSHDEQAARGVKAGFTLGLGCADTEGCSTPSQVGVSALDGTFAVAVPKGGAASDLLRVTAVVERGPARVATGLVLPATAHAGREVGTLPLPTGSPRVGGSAVRRRLLVPDLPGARLSAPAVGMARVRSVGPDGQPVLDAPSTDVSDGFDPRLVEDGRVMLASAQDGTWHGSRVVLTTSLVVTGDVVPASRGAACTVLDSRGRPLLQRPCGLTDGALDTPWTPQDDPRCANGPCPGSAQHDHRDVTVRFTHPLRVRLLVVRGCGFTCHVLVTDAHGEHRLPDPDQTASPDALYVQVLDGAPLRAIHVVTATGGFLASLREVSAFV